MKRFKKADVDELREHVVDYLTQGIVKNPDWNLLLTVGRPVFTSDTAAFAVEFRIHRKKPKKKRRRQKRASGAKNPIDAREWKRWLSRPARRRPPTIRTGPPRGGFFGGLPQ